MQGRRILVVDDDKDVVQFLAGLLRKAGYTILIAMDATQAVMQAHREVPDVILTDITMPAGGGFTVLERLTQSTRTMQIPILVLTGTDDSDLGPAPWPSGRAASCGSPVTTPLCWMPSRPSLRRGGRDGVAGPDGRGR
jgi:CheY-like chemotaxis protein